MTEREELKQLNEGLRSLQSTVNNIEDALIGGKFNELGVIDRVANIEKKIKRIDRAFYMLLGAVTLGAYPVGVRISEIVKPFISQYIVK